METTSLPISKNLWVELTTKYTKEWQKSKFLPRPLSLRPVYSVTLPQQKKRISKLHYNYSETSYPSSLGYKLLEDNRSLIFTLPSASNRNAINICYRTNELLPIFSQVIRLFSQLAESDSPNQLNKHQLLPVILLDGKIQSRNGFGMINISCVSYLGNHWVSTMWCQANGRKKKDRTFFFFFLLMYHITKDA